jgi:hypothetical protein
MWATLVPKTQFYILNSWYEKYLKNHVHMLHHLSSFKQPIPREYRCHKRLQQPGLQGVFNSVGEMKGAGYPWGISWQPHLPKGCFLKSAFLLANNPERWHLTFWPRVLSDEYLPALICNRWMEWGVGESNHQLTRIGGQEVTRRYSHLHNFGSNTRLQ